MRSAPFWIVLATTLGITGVEVLLITELVLFAKGRPPVTSVVRGTVEANHTAALLVSHLSVFGTGFAVAHLIADAREG